jgi:hypothetical protein
LMESHTHIGKIMLTWLPFLGQMIEG